MVADSYAKTAAGAKQAVQCTSDLGLALLQQPFLNLDLGVPADEKKSAWSANSDALQRRVGITRTGEKIAGGSCPIVALISLRVVVAGSVPQNVIPEWRAFASKAR